MMDIMEVQPTSVNTAEDIPLPEVEIRSGEARQDKTPDQRPDSTDAVSHTSSTTGNTKRTQGVHISKYTVDTYFSFREGAFDSAVSYCKTNAITPEDGNLIGSWLLGEIDQWDCEQEKLVLLTENSLIVVRYDWVKNLLYSFKKMDLKDIKTVKNGDMVYPAWSLMPARDHGGVRVCTDDEDNAGFFSRWNFSGAAGMPYWTFIHHRLLYADGAGESATYNVDEFQDSLVQQVQEVYRTKKPEESLKVVDGAITIYTYASVTSSIYNQSALGYSKDRRGVNY